MTDVYGRKRVEERLRKEAQAKRELSESELKAETLRLARIEKARCEIKREEEQRLRTEREKRQRLEASKTEKSRVQAEKKRKTNVQGHFVNYWLADVWRSR